jgi:hypothetical protein
MLRGEERALDEQQTRQARKLLMRMEGGRRGLLKGAGRGNKKPNKREEE